MVQPSLKIPGHVAILMDGNDLWAKAHGVSLEQGHAAGAETLMRITRECINFGIHYLTVSAFSQVDWSGTDEALTGLMTVWESRIDNDLAALTREGIQIRTLGRMEALPAELQQKIKHSINATSKGTNIVLTIAWNYSGRDEIARAVQRIARHKIAPEALSDELIDEYLFTRGVPDPDLIIRTSGESHVIDFLIWQSAYSEWYFTPTLWPDFDREELRKALAAYSQRERRFGKVSPEDTDKPHV